LRPFFEIIGSNADKEAFCKQIAIRFGLEPESVLKDLLSAPKTSPFNSGKVTGAYANSVNSDPELKLLTAVAVNCEAYPELFEDLRKNLSKEELLNKDAKEIYLALEESFRNNSTVSGGAIALDAVLSHIEDSALRVYITEKSAVHEFSGENAVCYVADGIRNLKLRLLKKKSRKLDMDIILARNEGRDADIKELLQEKQLINDELLGNALEQQEAK
jgi:hypothetical protein